MARHGAKAKETGCVGPSGTGERAHHPWHLDPDSRTAQNTPRHGRTNGHSRGEPRPGADVATASPVLLQMWEGPAQSRRASVRADRVVRVWVLWIGYAYAARCLPRACLYYDKGTFRPLHATCLRGRDRRGALGAWKICCVAPRHDPCALTADAPRRAPEWPTEGFHIYIYTYIHIYIYTYTSTSTYTYTYTYKDTYIHMCIYTHIYTYIYIYIFIYVCII